MRAMLCFRGTGPAFRSLPASQPGCWERKWTWQVPNTRRGDTWQIMVTTGARPALPNWWKLYGRLRCEIHGCPSPTAPCQAWLGLVKITDEFVTQRLL